jgi:hypothetical protein
MMNPMRPRVPILTGFGRSGSVDSGVERYIGGQSNESMNVGAMITALRKKGDATRVVILS